MTRWQYFPKSEYPEALILKVITAFEKRKRLINSSKNKLLSNDVLNILRKDLEKLGFSVEKSKKRKDKITVPVLFGKDGKLEKGFDADAYCAKKGIVIEIEAGRTVANYQFLKDLFQACMMKDVNFLVIAVRKTYAKRKDFDMVSTFFETLYASNRLRLPLEGILIIGY